MPESGPSASRASKQMTTWLGSEWLVCSPAPFLGQLPLLAWGCTDPEIYGQTFYAIETALAYSVGAVAKGMANNAMTDEQRAALSPDSEEYRLRLVGHPTLHMCVGLLLTHIFL